MAATPADTVLPSVSLAEPGRAFLAGEPVPMARAGEAPDARTIVVDPDDRDQPLLGLGSILTGTDLAALRRLPRGMPLERAAVQ